jgi:hypothetical protein
MSGRGGKSSGQKYTMSYSGCWTKEAAIWRLLNVLKVWVVEGSWDYEGSQIIAIYASQELAEAKVAACKQDTELSCDHFYATEYEVMGDA